MSSGVTLLLEIAIKTSLVAVASAQTIRGVRAFMRLRESKRALNREPFTNSQIVPVFAQLSYSYPEYDIQLSPGLAEKIESRTSEKNKREKSHSFAGV